MNSKTLNAAYKALESEPGTVEAVVYEDEIEAVLGERWGGNSVRQDKSLRIGKSQNATEDCNAKYTAEFIGDAFDGAGHAGFIFWRVDHDGG